jgi:hypothetical protein
LNVKATTIEKTPMSENDYLLKKLKELEGLRVDKVDWFVTESGLSQLKVDMQTSLKANANLVSNTPLVMKFMSNGDYLKLVEIDPREALKVYWKELLERTRFCVIVSIHRAQKWLEGIFLGVHYENFFNFAAAYRGLIEAITDSLDAINVANSSLIEHKSMITRILEGKIPLIETAQDYAHYLDKEFEDSLIHFSHARETWREKDLKHPPSHKKKKFGEYLTSINLVGKEKVQEAWFELCQITHPSAKTTMAYVMPRMTDVKNSASLYEAGVPRDFIEISRFTLKHGDLLAKLSNEFFGKIIYCQTLLADIPYKRVHEPKLVVIENKGA